MRKVLISLFMVSALGMFVTGCQSSEEVADAAANATEIVTESIEETVEAVVPSDSETTPEAE